MDKQRRIPHPLVSDSYLFAAENANLFLPHSYVSCFSAVSVLFTICSVVYSIANSIYHLSALAISLLASPQGVII